MRKMTQKQWDEWAKLSEDLQDKLLAYNEAVNAARAFRDELVNDMESYMAERSEKWQDSEAAATYESWKGEWEGLDLEEADEPDQIGNMTSEPG